MKKFSKNIIWILRTIAISILLILFIIIKKSDATKYSKVKDELEQAVDKSYDEKVDTVNISALKDNIEKGVSSAEILNPEATDFPVVTSVEKYKFKVEENGNIEDITKSSKNDINESSKVINSEDALNMENTQNIIQNEDNSTNNTLINGINNEVENIINNNTITTDNTEKTNEKIVDYIIEDKQNYKGISIHTIDDGTVVLNGKAISNIFIKISNGIECETNGNLNTALAKTLPAIIESGKKLKIQIKEISGLANTFNIHQQVNIVTKSSDGTIVSNCKLKENMMNQELILQKNISLIYIFVSQNVQFDNYTIKPVITTD